MNAIRKLKSRWPVTEVFGPTIQGEGVDQGAVSHFVRFGGCDFRCDWCDTPYAVIPKEVKANAQMMDTRAILDALGALPTKAPWVVLSGGNPCLHELGQLVDALQGNGYAVAVETQGSKWRQWLRGVDRLCLSPKPPSAMVRYDWTSVQRFFNESMSARSEDKDYEWMFLKIVIFDEKDLDWAVSVRKQLSNCLLYLSAGNDAGRTVGSPNRIDNRDLTEIRNDLYNRSRKLAERVFARPDLCATDVLVQSQYHVGLWGNEKGR